MSSSSSPLLGTTSSVSSVQSRKSTSPSKRPIKAHLAILKEVVKRSAHEIQNDESICMQEENSLGSHKSSLHRVFIDTIGLTDYCEVGWAINDDARLCLCPKSSNNNQPCLNRFNSMWRGKHHCYACGNIVCAECSENRARIEGIEDAGKLRVCDECYQLRMTGDTGSITPKRTRLKSASAALLRDMSDPQDLEKGPPVPSHQLETRISTDSKPVEHQEQQQPEQPTSSTAVGSSTDDCFTPATTRNTDLITDSAGNCESYAVVGGGVEADATDNYADGLGGLSVYDTFSSLNIELPSGSGRTTVELDPHASLEGHLLQVLPEVQPLRLTECRVLIAAVLVGVSSLLFYLVACWLREEPTARVVEAPAGMEAGALGIFLSGTVVGWLLFRVTMLMPHRQYADPESTLEARLHMIVVDIWIFAVSTGLAPLAYDWGISMLYQQKYFGDLHDYLFSYIRISGILLLSCVLAEIVRLFYILKRSIQHSPFIPEREHEGPSVNPRLFPYPGIVTGITEALLVGLGSTVRELSNRELLVGMGAMLLVGFMLGVLCIPAQINVLHALSRTGIPLPVQRLDVRHRAIAWLPDLCSLLAVLCVAPLVADLLVMAIAGHRWPLFLVLISFWNGFSMLCGACTLLLAIWIVVAAISNLWSLCIQCCCGSSSGHWQHQHEYTRL